MRFDWREYARPPDVQSGPGNGISAGREISAGCGAGGGERDSFGRRCGAATGGGVRRIFSGGVADAGGVAGRSTAGVGASTRWPRGFPKVTQGRSTAVLLRFSETKSSLRMTFGFRNLLTTDNCALVAML